MFLNANMTGELLF